MELLKLAVNYRNAIEIALNNNELDFIPLFDNFPKGSCGITCDLLGEYLLRNGYATKYVCGTKYGNTPFDSQSHAWLLYNNIIIDITGDQFKNNSKYLYNNNKVYVGKENDFYKLFNIEDRRIYTCLGIQNDYQLKDIYKKIEKYL